MDSERRSSSSSKRKRSKVGLEEPVLVMHVKHGTSLFETSL
jgi:hypothetical protein